MFKFKSMQMSKELNFAGDFIYESAKKTMQLENVHDDFTINGILYNGSIGIERLQKIYLYLCEEDSFEVQLKLHTHNLITLENGVYSESSEKLFENGIKLISMFVEYYSEYRYGNFHIEEKEKTLNNLFTSFLKTIDKKADFDSIFMPIDFERFKKFYIDTLGKVANHYYKLIRKKACELGIFTYELSSLSNSTRVFSLGNGKTLYDEMLLEQEAIKELLLYFYKTHSDCNVFKAFNELEPLEFDDYMMNDFLTLLENGKTNHTLTDWVSENYNELDKKELKLRRAIVSAIGNPNVEFDLDEEDDTY